jgi:hypothetical protein
MECGIRKLSNFIESLVLGVVDNSSPLDKAYDKARDEEVIGDVACEDYQTLSRAVS